MRRTKCGKEGKKIFNKRLKSIPVIHVPRVIGKWHKLRLRTTIDHPSLESGPFANSSFLPSLCLAQRLLARKNATEALILWGRITKRHLNLTAASASNFVSSCLAWAWNGDASPTLTQRFYSLPSPEEASGRRTLVIVIKLHCRILHSPAPSTDEIKFNAT